MPSDHGPSFLDRSDELLRVGRFKNFVAQSHSRDVLRYLGTPVEDWPEYTASLDEDLVYTAQHLLYLGLRLKADPETSAAADANLTLGAEILEHVYARSDDEDPERATQLFTAGLAYYVAGHFARAFVLVRDLEAGSALPRFVRPLRHLLLKDFGQLRSFVVAQLFEDGFADEMIASQLASGALGEDEAYCRVFEASLFRALSHFVEYAKSGSEDLLVTAESLLDDGIELAVEQRFADWWWYFSFARAMLATYRVHSLWTNLQPLLGTDATEPIAEGYIRANLRLPTPVVELWPSQVTAIPHLFGDSTRKNICLRMPTSAGKTKIAELAILRFLSEYVDDPDAKCVYVAPFRSLAVEVEQTLRRVFSPLGIRVSELYGGFELTQAEQVLIQKTHILVATPEKLDALLRFSPELVGTIRLVILDEGHIVAPPNFKFMAKSRGLKYEVFLQRLIRRFEATESRVVFLSAVMPNADQFAEWITGDASGLVTSNWRPARLMLGEAVWDGKIVSIEYTHANHKQLDHRCFVRRFVTSTPAKSISGRRSKPFPSDCAEALALTALEFANRGMTMIFVARKISAEPLGRTVLKCMELRRRITTASEPLALQIADSHKVAVKRCIALIREQMGEDSEIADFLESGFVVHHGSLPQAVRLGLERLVREGAIKLVIATTTLAQGVNFPIHTVLVHSLDHGHNDPVSPMDFWNICGRAGRGMKENEGQVLFFVDHCFAEWKANPSRKKWLPKLPENRHHPIWQKWCAKKKIERENYLTSYGNYRVESGLLAMVSKVAALWQAKHASVNVAELCEALANHRLELFAPEEGVDLDALLSCLDGLLISLSEEDEGSDVSPELFDKLLHRSLLFLQLENDSQRKAVSRVFAARLSYIHKQHPDVSKRLQFYRLGLPLRDCEKVDLAREQLLELFLEASDYAEWDVEQRSKHLADVAQFLFELHDIAPISELPGCWRRLLTLWLSGQTPTQISADEEVRASKMTAHGVSRWIDDVCGYRLPWGYNLLSIYLMHVAEESSREIPDVCNHYSSFVKYGVHEPFACWLLSFGAQSRLGAIRASNFISQDITEPKALMEWLLDGGIEVLRQSGIDSAMLDLLTESLLGSEASDRRLRPSPLSIRIPLSATSAKLEASTRLLLRPSPGSTVNEFDIFTLHGECIGTFSMVSPTPALWKLLENPELINAVVDSIDATSDDRYAVVLVQAV